MHPIEDIRGGPGTPLHGRTIILGITGSIAAVETVKLARSLAREGARVVPVMTEAACGIIHPDALGFATGMRPITRITGDVEHVMYCGARPGDHADLLLIAPCTANTISKIALGIDDTPVTTFATTAIGSGIPLMIAPAMHASMRDHPAVRENLDRLVKMGIGIVSPRTEEGKDKLASNRLIVDHAVRMLSPPMKGRALVIYGASVEPLDPMRVITNRSTGEMGRQLSRALFRRGFDVTTLLPSAMQGGEFSRNIPFSSTSDIIAWLEDLASKEEAPDVIALPAAISDYSPSVVSELKLPSGNGSLTLELMPTPKVLDRIHGLFPASRVVAFKADSGIEYGELIERARKRIDERTATLVVANLLEDVSPRSTRVFVLSGTGEPEKIEGTKEEVAGRLAGIIAELMQVGHGTR